MYSYCTNYAASLPDISVYVNCDTIIAVNLKMLELDDSDEFIFTLKNYDYNDAPYIFIFRARKTDADDRGEVVFKIPQNASKHLKPGAFYTIAVLNSAFDTQKESVYTGILEKGTIILKHGKQDITAKIDEDIKSDYEIINMRLEPLDNSESTDTISPIAEIIGLRLELI